MWHEEFLYHELKPRLEQDDGRSANLLTSGKGLQKNRPFYRKAYTHYAVLYKIIISGSPSVESRDCQQARPRTRRLS